MKSVRLLYIFVIIFCIIIFSSCTNERINTLDGVSDTFLTDADSILTFASRDDEATQTESEQTVKITENQSTTSNNASQECEPEQDIQNNFPNEDDLQAKDITTQNTEQTVWISEKGTKYHIINTCSNMKTPKSVDIDFAKSSGYEPCKRCIK